MKSNSLDPIEFKVSSTKTFKNTHWKFNLLSSPENFNPLIQLSDVGDVYCQSGGERPLNAENTVSWYIMFVKKGSASLLIKKGVYRTVKENDIIIHPPGEPIELKVKSPSFHVFRLQLVDSGAMRDLFSGEISLTTILHPRKPELLQQEFARILRLLEQEDERTSLFVSASCFIICSEIVRQCLSVKPPDSILAVRGEIACFPTKHYSIPFLAQSCNMSVRSFQRQFQKIAGCSPLTFILQARIQIACRLLSNSSFSIQDIASRCRYETSSQFSKCFKKYMGESPREYRKKYWHNTMEYYQAGQRKSGINSWELFEENDLTEIEKELLHLLLKNPSMQIAEVAEKIGQPPAKTKNLLQSLKEKKIIEKKKNSYRLLEKGGTK